MQTKSIKKNSIFSLLKTGSSILFPLITFPYINRVLLPDNVGKIEFSVSIVSYFTLIAMLGISSYAIRECTVVRDDRDKLSRFASEIFSVNVLMMLVSYLLLALTLVFYHKVEGYRILIIIYSTTILAATAGADWLNSAMEDFKYLSLRTFSFQLLSLVLMFIFVRKTDDYVKYAIISAVSSGGANITNIIYRRRYCNIGFTLKIDWKRHLKPVLFLSVMLVAQTIFSSADSTMLGLIHGDHEVGIYSTAHKILNIINQVFGAVLWAVLPRLSLLFDRKEYDKLGVLLRKVLGFNVTLGLPCITGIIMIADDVILLVGGEEYIEAAPVLRIMMFGFLFSLFGGCFLGNAILLPARREKYYMIACCVSAALNVITNYIFIPKYGVIAAAWTTTLSSVVILVMLLLNMDKRVKIRGWTRLLIMPALGCVLIGIICFLCRSVSNFYIRLAVSIAASGAAYGIVLLVSKNELLFELLDAVKRKLMRK